MANVLVQSQNKMHMKYILHNKFRMIIFHDQKVLSLNFKSSRSQMFFKIDILKNLAMFTGKHLGLLFNIVAGLEHCNCIKKRFQHKCFLVKIAKIFKNTYFEEPLQTAASVLLIIKLLIKYWISAKFFLIRNMTLNGFYYEVCRSGQNILFDGC